MKKKKKLSEQSVLVNAESIRRKKYMLLQVGADGEHVVADQRDIIKSVLQDQDFKEELADDVKMLFENYLELRVPRLLAEILKEKGFRNGSANFTPNDLIIAFKTHFVANLSTASGEKQAAVNSIKRQFRGYIEKYVKTILENTEF